MLRAGRSARAAGVVGDSGHDRSIAPGRRRPSRRRRRPRRRLDRAVGRGLRSSVIPSHRRKIRAVFWPPNPNEFQGHPHVRRSSPFGVRSSPSAPRVGIHEVDRRRHAAVADRLDRDDRLDRACRAERVAEHRLVGRDRDLGRVLAEDRPDRLQLGLVALGRRGRVGVDVVDLVRSMPAFSIARRAARTAPIPPGAGSVMCAASAVAP